MFGLLIAIADGADVALLCHPVDQRDNKKIDVTLARASLSHWLVPIFSVYINVRKLQPHYITVIA